MTTSTSFGDFGDIGDFSDNTAPATLLSCTDMLEAGAVNANNADAARRGNGPPQS